ncbi:MAG: phospholipase D family protein [Acidobacteria bacterium]|nr:phospholipase D family protein [Acidobacteriota bacterium]
MNIEILSGATSFADRFRECCSRYDRLDLAVAWCGDPSKTLPYDQIGAFRGQVDATVGIALNRTHPDAVSWFMGRQRTQVRIVDGENVFFHPKVYLFTKGDAFALFVGSSNLTFSGFYKNVEVNAYCEGSLSARGASGVKELRGRLSEWRTDSFSFVPSVRWLNGYRKRYQASLAKARKAGLVTEPQVEEQVASASWLRQADWNVYYGKVLAGLRGSGREGGLRTALDAGERLLPRPWKTSYFSDVERRRVINGLGDDYASLGHVGASGAFRQLVRNGTAQQHATIVRSMNAISALPRPIPWRRLERVLHDLVRIGPTMKVWGRLLCLVRPDLFCTVAAPTVRANLSQVVGIGQGRFADVDGYIELIRLLHASPWFNTSAPQTRRAKEIWNRRVAYMDAIFY